MNTVLIPPGPGGYGKGLWLPVASGKKVLSLTGREIHPVAIEIGALTESEVVNGFSDIPPDNDILCVVINCAGSLRCGLYPQKGIPTINVLPTWRAGPLAQFISEDNYVSGVTIEQLVLVDTAEAPDGEPEPVSVTAPRIITTPPPARGAEKLVRMVERTGTAVGHVIALLFAASREAVDVSLRNVIPFMAFVSLLIALVQETALGSLIAHALTPLANSLWGLVLLSLICGIPFLSPVLGPGGSHLAGHRRDDWHPDWRGRDIPGLRPARAVRHQRAGRLRLRAGRSFDAGGEAGDHREGRPCLSALTSVNGAAGGHHRLAVFPGLILRTSS